MRNFSGNTLLCLDDAECLDLVWSPDGTYLACIRREPITRATQAYLIQLEVMNPLVPTYANQTTDHRLVKRLKNGPVEASLLSFSPQENWLVVGEGMPSQNLHATFYIYDLTGDLDMPA